MLMGLWQLLHLTSGWSFSNFAIRFPPRYNNLCSRRSQKDFTDRAFRRRVDEIKKAKEDLEKQLSETIVKIGEMEDGIKDLERAIASKQGPLATCQRKIQQRKQRPNIELVNLKLAFFQSGFLNYLSGFINHHY